MKKNKKEIYISTDIESDGPIPGINSMLSIGSAAFVDGGMVGIFSANLKQMSEASADERTMTEFWDKNPEAWKACRTDLQDPESVMKNYVKWLKELEKEHKGRLVFVAYPAGFDWTYVYWYLMKFVGESPFSFSALDIKSLAMGILKKPFRSCTKRGMPRSWFNFDYIHNHIALDDAIGQGLMFMNILRELGMISRSSVKSV